ncbi:hypothetical protein ENU1_179240 [Entamoeba nuttalli P19]|uniref:Importin alpha n=1 Tax=Entamoeba nuttalli (strain P19) TaxID=1076696 RepID=K2GSP3_ENTNP|nr:hypothetical protein ENU1_179240 [Entamoeba nuttalli P19]EKE38013.1 hypothetical protein ENU1_179240 [Entamoeba nuttalli P19]|eukprot:XP_008859652.1 hypothetical protein ENU1_179240 [Entamoeba nuttalli P19]
MWRTVRSLHELSEEKEKEISVLRTKRREQFLQKKRIEDNNHFKEVNLEDINLFINGVKQKRIESYRCLESLLEDNETPYCIIQESGIIKLIIQNLMEEDETIIQNSLQLLNGYISFPESNKYTKDIIKQGFLSTIPNIIEFKSPITIKNLFYLICNIIFDCNEEDFNYTQIFGTFDIFQYIGKVIKLNYIYNLVPWMCKNLLLNQFVDGETILKAIELTTYLLQKDDDINIANDCIETLRLGLKRPETSHIASSETICKSVIARVESGTIIRRTCFKYFFQLCFEDYIQVIDSTGIFNIFSSYLYSEDEELVKLLIGAIANCATTEDPNIMIKISKDFIPFAINKILNEFPNNQFDDLSRLLFNSCIWTETHNYEPTKNLILLYPNYIKAIYVSLTSFYSDDNLIALGLRAVSDLLMNITDLNLIEQFTDYGLDVFVDDIQYKSTSKRVVERANNIYQCWFAMSDSESDNEYENYFY